VADKNERKRDKNAKRLEKALQGIYGDLAHEADPVKYGKDLELINDLSPAQKNLVLTAQQQRDTKVSIIHIWSDGRAYLTISTLTAQLDREVTYWLVSPDGTYLQRDRRTMMWFVPQG
jgi:hypothetical protein